MQSNASVEPLKEHFIGYAFHFKNAALKFDWYGSPHEIMKQMADAQIAPISAAKHIATEIKANKVYKDGRSASFNGGPNAAALIELLDVFAKRNWALAEQILNDKPALLSDGETAAVTLGFYASWSDIEAVKFLVDHGALVNGAGDLGMTALHWAAAHGNPNIISNLLSAGAYPDSLNWFLLSPAQLAVANGKHEAVRVLIPGGGQPPTVELMTILKAMGCR